MPLTFIKPFISCLTVVVLSAVSASSLAQTTLSKNDEQQLKKAREFLDAGQGAAALKQLEPLEMKLAGEPAFDDVYGRAALATNQPSIALFALERCLEVDPNRVSCQLSMSKAYIALNDPDNARSYLHSLRAHPDTAVQQTVSEYADMIGGMATQDSDTRLSSYLQFGIGFDTNINAVTSQENMLIPGLGPGMMRLRPENKRKESGFASARYSLRYSTPLGEGWRFLTQMDLSGTGNFETSDFNTLVGDLSVGVSKQIDSHRFIVKLLAQNYRLRGDSYRNTVGMLGQYTYSLSNNSEIGAWAQYTRLNYSSTTQNPNNGLRNAHRYVGGLTWWQGVLNDRGLVYANVYGGAQETVNQGPLAKHYSFDLVGARLGIRYLAMPQLQLNASFGIEDRHYRGQNPLFLKSRQETFYDVSLGATWSINRKLSIRPQYNYNKSSSNMPLYQYDRHVFSINLRYELF